MQVVTRWIATLVVAVLLLQPTTAFGATAAICSLCATDCYSTYSDDLELCSWRIWCQNGAKAERDACLGNCIIDGCGTYDWFPDPSDGGADDFWASWLL